MTRIQLMPLMPGAMPERVETTTGVVYSFTGEWEAIGREGYGRAAPVYRSPDNDKIVLMAWARTFLKEKKE